ncbi:unnamed protein product [Trichobilharzia regenti]|nr:unnamed protein product [Trichobilharzia regenti]
MAFSYAGLMHPRKAKWVSEEEFHLKEKTTTRPEINTNYSVNHQNPNSGSHMNTSQFSNRTVSHTDTSGVTATATPTTAHNLRGQSTVNQQTNSANANTTGSSSSSSNIQSSAPAGNTNTTSTAVNTSIGSATFEPPHVSVSVRRTTTTNSSAATPSSGNETRLRCQTANPPTVSVETSKSASTVNTSTSGSSSSGAVANNSVASSATPQTTTQSKLRSSQRLEATMSVTDEDAPAVSNSQSHSSSKRRRVETVNSNNTNSSNGCVLTMSSSKVST